MASAFGHFCVGASLAIPFTALPAAKKVMRPAGLVLASGILAISPDFDTLFFGLIPYAHFFGHRGFFHSSAFALMSALFLASLIYAVSRTMGYKSWIVLIGAFTLAMASHGVLDAMTGAGQGVMLLYPFSEQRMFLAWRPLHAPPVSLSRMTWDHVRIIMQSELPVALACLIGFSLLRVAMVRKSFGRRHKY